MKYKKATKLLEKKMLHTKVEIKAYFYLIPFKKKQINKSNINGRFHEEPWKIIEEQDEIFAITQSFY